jgi:hypothetical protein
VASAPNSKGSSDDLSNPVWFANQLFFGDANYFLASRTKIEVAPSIILERSAATMSGIPVRFDNQSPLRPVEIGKVRPHPHVDLGLRQVEVPAECQEFQLQVAAAAFTPCLVIDRQAEEVRLPNRSTELLRRNHVSCRRREVPQVGDCSHRIRNRNPVSQSYVSGQEDQRPMSADPLASPPATASPHGDVNRAAARRHQSPELGGATVANSGTPVAKDRVRLLGHLSTRQSPSPLPTRQHRRHPLAVPRSRRMPNCVDPLMDAMQSTGLDPT